MTLNIHGIQPSRSGNDRRGFILIITVIIIAAVLSIILIGSALSAITQLEMNSASLKGFAAAQHTDGCAEEAMLMLNRDNSYAGGDITLVTGSCIIAVAGAGNTRTITVTGNAGAYYRTLTINVTLSPFGIDTWDN